MPITGSVLPASPGKTVRITIQKNCSVVAVINAKLTPGPNGTSLFAAVWNAKKLGRYKITASVAKTSLAGCGQAVTTTSL